MTLFEFKFPDVGEGIHEGTIVKWLVKQGDAVEADQILGEVETDKAVVEIPSPKKGKIVKLHAEEGHIIKVGQTMVTFEVAGEAAPVQKEAPKGIVGEKAGGVVGFLPESESDLFKKEAKQEKKAEARVGGVLATPAVRKLAVSLGVDINSLKGTGPDGMVTQDDVVRASKGAVKTEVPVQATPKVIRKYDMWGYIDHIPLRGIRRATAQRMEAAWKIPMVTHMDEADATMLMNVREKEKEKAKKKGIHLTYLAFIVKATAEVLKNHPYLNATLDKETDGIILKKYYNIGVAVDTKDGLIVPVVKGVQVKDLYTVAKEIEELAAKTRDRTIDLADLQGESFGITNIGSIGGVFFTPVINSPDVAILGIGKMHDKAVVKEGKVVVQKVLPLVLSYDHRVVDGAEAARFMNDLIALLQDPGKLV